MDDVNIYSRHLTETGPGRPNFPWRWRKSHCGYVVKIKPFLGTSKTDRNSPVPVIWPQNFPLAFFVPLFTAPYGVVLARWEWTLPISRDGREFLSWLLIQFYITFPRWGQPLGLAEWRVLRYDTDLPSRLTNFSSINLHSGRHSLGQPWNAHALPGSSALFHSQWSETCSLSGLIMLLRFLATTNWQIHSKFAAFSV